MDNVQGAKVTVSVIMRKADGGLDRRRVGFAHLDLTAPELERLAAPASTFTESVLRTVFGDALAEANR